MRRSNKIKTALIVSLLIHILIMALVKNIIEYTPYKDRIIDVEYYTVEPETEVPAEKKKRESKKVKKTVKKTIKRPKKIVKPKPAKKEFAIKKEPKKTEIVQKEKPLPEPSVSAAPRVKENVIEEEATVKEPEEKKKFTLLKELLRREELKKREEAEDGVAYQKADDEKEKKGVRISRILPSMERLEELSRLEAENTRGLGDTELETIRLDSANIRYVSYLDHIKLAIELAWNYPEAAARRRIEGEGVLSFTIAKEGELKAIKLLSTTGSKILDERFLRAVKMASPFPPIPKNIKTRNLKIVATYRYILSIVY